MTQYPNSVYTDNKPRTQFQFNRYFVVPMRSQSPSGGSLRRGGVFGVDNVAVQSEKRILLQFGVETPPHYGTRCQPIRVESC